MRMEDPIISQNLDAFHQILQIISKLELKICFSCFNTRNSVFNNTAVPSGSVVSDFPDVLGIPDGSYNLTIVAMDLAGNIAKETLFFTLDTTPPTITIVSPTASLNGEMAYQSVNFLFLKSFDKYIPCPSFFP